MTRHNRETQRRKNYIVLAENFYLDNNRDKAIKFFKKALEFDGIKEEDISILFNIAAIHDELGNVDESLIIYKKIT